MTASNDHTVHFIRHFDAPVADLWAACTEPQWLIHWFAPAPFHDCTVEADVRVGGRFFFRMTGDPGTFAAEGTYQEVVPLRRLSLTWTWTEGPPDEPPDGTTSSVSIDLTPEGDGTRLALTHALLPDRRQADSHRQGWMECLDKLAALLAGAKASPPVLPKS